MSPPTASPAVPTPHAARRDRLRRAGGRLAAALVGVVLVVSGCRLGTPGAVATPPAGHLSAEREAVRSVVLRASDLVPPGYPVRAEDETWSADWDGTAWEVHYEHEDAAGSLSVLTHAYFADTAVDAQAYWKALHTAYQMARPADAVDVSLTDWGDHRECVAMRGAWRCLAWKGTRVYAFVARGAVVRPEALKVALALRLARFEVLALGPAP